MAGKSTDRRMVRQQALGKRDARGCASGRLVGDGSAFADVWPGKRRLRAPWAAIRRIPGKTDFRFNLAGGRMWSTQREPGRLTTSYLPQVDPEVLAVDSAYCRPVRGAVARTGRHLQRRVAGAHCRNGARRRGLDGVPGAMVSRSDGQG